MKNKAQKEIEKFIKNNPINTNAAIAIPKVTIEYYDDGDTGYYIKVPYCSWNSTWRNSAFKFIENFQKQFGSCPIILNSKYFRIVFNLTMCDPD